MRQTKNQVFMKEDAEKREFVSEDVKSPEASRRPERASERTGRVRQRISRGEKVSFAPHSHDENRTSGYGRSNYRVSVEGAERPRDFESWKERRERNESRENQEERPSRYSRSPRMDNWGEANTRYNSREKYQPARTQYGNREYSSRYGGNYNRENQPDRFNQVGSEYQAHERFYNRRDDDRRSDNRTYGRGNSGNGNTFKPHRPTQNSDYDPTSKYSQKKVLRYKEENVDPSVPIRLNRFLSNSGVCSRRDADKLIESGVVTVNGVVVTELGTKVFRTDTINVKGKDVSIEDKVYILMNKPKDCVTTADDPEGRKTVMDLIKGALPERVYPIGRLDRNTTGVLLLTNDGELAAKIMHPKFEKKKIYHVYLNKPITEEKMQVLRDGIELEDGVIKADALEYADEADKKQVGIEIHSGRNRIVRRMFEFLHMHVVKLDRVYFAGMTKKNLRRGQWRFLTPEEVRILRMGAFE